MKTLQECKDEVAINKGFKNWSSVDWYQINEVMQITTPPYAEEKLFLQASELFEIQYREEIQRKDEENKELKQWKESQIKQSKKWDKVHNFAQESHLFKVGDDIPQTIVNILVDHEKKVEEIERLKFQHGDMALENTVLASQVETLESELVKAKEETIERKGLLVDASCLINDSEWLNKYDQFLRKKELPQQNEDLESEIIKVCEKYGWVVPDAWCKPNDLIMEVTNGALFLCGNDPKDVAELRRRNVSFKKVDTDTLRKFLLTPIETPSNEVGQNEELTILNLQPFLRWVFNKADRIWVEHTLGWRENAIQEMYDAYKNQIKVDEVKPVEQTNQRANNWKEKAIENQPEESKESQEELLYKILIMNGQGYANKSILEKFTIIRTN